jgi:choline dehydrogenase-like flavoprotein
MENTEAESVMERDVIAVGGGSAGAVLATRFTEDSHRTVLAAPLIL